MTREIDGLTVNVEDGRFSGEWVRGWHEHLKLLPYAWLRHNRQDTPPLPAATCPPVLLSALASEKKILRAQVNRSSFGDAQFAHRDQGARRTLLYFANHEWDLDWGGEVLFYSGDEIALAVAPKPGRIIEFDSQILHRGGVPSRVCPEARIVVAVKYA